MIKLDYLPYYPSPNKRARKPGKKPQWIVIHAMVGYYGSFKPSAGTIGLFMRPGDSAHYLVSRKGEMCNMVKDELCAFHTLRFNDDSIGIEFEDMIPKVKGNCMTNPKWHTPEQLKAGAELVATLMQKHKIDIKHVIGHNDPMLHKAPYKNDHTDPGPYFPWVDFRKMVEGFLNDGKPGK